MQRKRLGLLMEQVQQQAQSQTGLIAQAPAAVTPRPAVLLYGSVTLRTTMSTGNTSPGGNHHE